MTRQGLGWSTTAPSAARILISLVFAATWMMSTRLKLRTGYVLAVCYNELFMSS